MKISYNWLKRYLDFDIEPADLSHILTDCGLEIEGMEEFQSVKGGLKGIVIGEVKTAQKHPNADRLTVTTVDIGSKNLLPIVCGAPNVAEGQKVAVALTGTTMYSGNDKFIIKKSKIRGEVSEGMICAEDELGLGTSHEGIMVLDKNAIVGNPAAEYFEIVNDTVFEIGLTPNRADATSHIGVARDIAAVINNFNGGNNQLSKNRKQIEMPSVDQFKVDNHNRKIDIIVKDIKACPRYTGLTITGVEVKESPEWLKNYLNAIDVRPINNIVDISNFVLFETGQPLHIFDAEEISGDKVVIKKMKQGTKFLSLDEVERELNSEDLMICNEKEGMCIAGVFGGIKSGVTEKTKDIFIESAYFDPVSVRKTSKYHNLKTDASFRFERGADPNITDYAIKRAAILLKEIAGGTVSSEIVDIYPEPITKWDVDLSYANVDRLIGKVIERDVIKNILTDLGIEVTKEDSKGLKLLIPTYKVDVTREADIIEEILRIYGYNNIEFSESIKSAISFSVKPDKEKIQNMVSDYLTSNGFSEIKSNSLTKSSYLEGNQTYKAENSVELFNPLSNDLNVMRQTLIFGGLEAINRNINRKLNNLRLYEFGSTYYLNDNNNKTGLIDKFTEEQHLALFTSGKVEEKGWHSAGSETDLYYTRAIANNTLKLIGIKPEEIKVEKISNDLIAEGFEYIFRNKKIMETGRVAKSTLDSFDIKQDVYYVDFNWGIVLGFLKKQKIEYQDIPKYPEVRRDLALLLGSDTDYAEIEKIAYQTERKFLKRVSLFDIYQGDKIEKGMKSYAVCFILQNEDKTMTDKEIDKIMNKLIRAFESQLDAVIR